MLQQSRSDTKLLQRDTGIIFITTRSSTAFFNKHLAGLKAATSHKLNCLLYLQGSENQRGAPGVARPCRDFSVTASVSLGTKLLHEARRERQHNDSPSPALLGTTFGKHSACGRSHEAAAPAGSCRSPRRPRSHGGVGSIAVRAFAPQPALRGLHQPAEAASSHLPATFQPGSEPREGQGQ